MKYSDFLNKMKNDQITVVMKDNHPSLLKELEKDIAVPSFYQEISDVEGVEMVQGKTIINPAHYEKQE